MRSSISDQRAAKARRATGVLARAHREAATKWLEHAGLLSRTGPENGKPSPLVRQVAWEEKAKPQFIPVRPPTVAANRYAAELMLVNGRVLRIGTDADPICTSQLGRELERAC